MCSGAHPLKEQGLILNGSALACSTQVVLIDRDLRPKSKPKSDPSRGRWQSCDDATLGFRQ